MSWREGSDGRAELVDAQGEIVGEVLAMGDGRYRPRLITEGASVKLADWGTREAAQHSVEVKLHILATP